MLNFTGPGVRLCDGVNRRQILKLGGLGAFGASLGLSDLLARPALGSSVLDPSFGRAKSCIVLFLMGGPDQHSTWDPKPDAPVEVRGPFGTIATKVPGMMLGELMPMTAQVADKLCVLRAVSTGDNAHSSSGYYMLTGRPHTPTNFENANPGAPNDSPVFGSLLGKLRPSDSGMPSAITIPHRIANTDGSVWPGQDAGFLGRSSDPWLLNVKPSPEGCKIDEISLPPELSPERILGRRDLLDVMQRGIDLFQKDGTAHAMDVQGRQALDLLRSPQARRAFQIRDEPDHVRERYGKSPFGENVLMARRMIEAGVRLVQCNWYRGANEPPLNPCWDSHEDEPNRLKNVLVPPTDRALSALISDLDARGMLDETLVVCMSEFGRSPRLEGNAGRGHWGSVFSVAMAGGGIRGGIVHGASDRFAAQPKDQKVRPEDLLATIFHCLGFSPDSEYLDPLNRPHPISRGEVIRAIL